MYKSRAQDYVEMQDSSDENNSLNISNNINSNHLDLSLYNDLVQIVPLVQSLIEQKPSESFSRRGSVIYTKAPSRKNGVRSKSGKKNANEEQNKNSKNDQKGAMDCAALSADMAAEKDREELNALKEQLEDLHLKLLQKDEFLNAAESSKNQMSSVQSQVEELKRIVAEKDSLIKSSQAKLHEAKIKLADKQAALEKLRWEAKTSDEKVEILQEELDSMQSEISSLIVLFEGLSKEDPPMQTEDYDVTPCFVDHCPDVDDMNENDIQKMEEARKAYLEAVEMAKEKQDEESLLAAARTRMCLQSLVFRINTEL